VGWTAVPEPLICRMEQRDCRRGEEKEEERKGIWQMTAI